MDKDNEDRRILDIVFVQDCTASMGSYISTAIESIEEICTYIFNSGYLQSPEDLRVGLVAYRDHPPQDYSYVTKKFGFSSDIHSIHRDLSSFEAGGGGDGPEALTPGLEEASNMDWRAHAVKMVVIVADAPPHGIGESGDGFDDGSPDGKDPLEIARAMARRGITLFFIACEPTLSAYIYAPDFYQALTALTGGLMLPLASADLFSRAIVGCVLENFDMERLVREVGDAVARRILENKESVDDVARDVHKKLLHNNESTKKLVVEKIHKESPEAANNVTVFMNASSLPVARPLLNQVPGSRFTDKYIRNRDSYSRPSKTTPEGTKPATALSMFSVSNALGTVFASTPSSLMGGKPAFGGDDDNDDDNGGEQKIGLEVGPVSLDQVSGSRSRR